MADTVDGLLEKLNGNDTAGRIAGANGLGNLAKEGQDISPAVSALEKAMADSNVVLRIRSAYALALHKLIAGESVVQMYESADDDMRGGIVQSLTVAMGRGADISELVPALEKDIARGIQKNGIGSALSGHYIKKGMADEASKLILGTDTTISFSSAASFRSAAMEGENLSAFTGLLEKALMSQDMGTANASAEALAYFYGNRKDWEKMNLLLIHKKTLVRQAAVSAAYRFALEMEPMPGICKALEEQDEGIASGAASALRRAAEGGKDISFALESLGKAAKSRSQMVREEAQLAIKAHLMNKGTGACPECKDCELGLGPGGNSLEEMAHINKEMACCAGEATSRILRCRACGKHYLSVYLNHTGFEPEYSYVYLVAKEDAVAAAEKIRQCPNPDDKKCGCPVHRGYLVADIVPIEGKTKYSKKIE
jgi:hypothetical protein